MDTKDGFHLIQSNDFLLLFNHFFHLPSTGFPVIDVSSKGDVLELTQERFLISGEIDQSLILIRFLEFSFQNKQQASNCGGFHWRQSVEMTNTSSVKAHSVKRPLPYQTHHHGSSWIPTNAECASLNTLMKCSKDSKNLSKNCSSLLWTDLKSFSTQASCANLGRWKLPRCQLFLMKM